MTYDFLVVGCGPSACAMIHRILATNRVERPQLHLRILVLSEDGEENPSPGKKQRQHERLSRPETRPRTTPQSNLNPRDWGAGLDTAYVSSLPPYMRVLDNMSKYGSLRGRHIEMPQGKGLGGSSNINAMLFCAPGEERLKKELGRETDDSTHWGKFCSQNDVLGEIYKIKDYLLAEKLITPTYKDKDFFKRLRKSQDGDVDSGFTNPFYASIDQSGSGRMNAFDSLVKPLLNNDSAENEGVNIKVRCGCDVKRVLFEGKIATGVVLKTGEVIRVAEGGEVILCCGAIFTPKILMQSGIGGFTMMDELGIANQYRVVDNDSVGKKCIDHLVVPRLFWTRKSTNDFKSYKQSCNGIKGWWSMNGDTSQSMVFEGSCVYQVIHHAFNCLRFTVGPVDSSEWTEWEQNVETGGGIKILTGLYVACLKLTDLILYLIFNFCVMAVLTVKCFIPRRVKSYIEGHLVTLNVNLVTVTTTGEVGFTRRANNHNDGDSDDCEGNDTLLEVDLKLNYLATPSDRETFSEGWKTSEKLKEKYYDDCVEILWPLYKFFFKNRTCVEYAGAFGTTYYHLHGSCRMGDVVDEKFRVMGVENLRLCDASVFGVCISSPTVLACEGLGGCMGKILYDSVKSRASKEVK